MIMCFQCNGAGLHLVDGYAFRCDKCNAAELKKISKSIPIYSGKNSLQVYSNSVKKEDYKQKQANPSDFKDDEDDVLV